MNDIALTIGLILMWSPVFYVVLLVLGAWWWWWGAFIAAIGRGICGVLLLRWLSPKWQQHFGYIKGGGE